MSLLGIYRTETITWRKAADPDQWGERAAPTDTSISARVIWKTQTVRNFAGDEVVAAGHVLMEELPDHEDLIRIGTVDHIILAINEIQDFTVSHYEVFIA